MTSIMTIDKDNPTGKWPLGSSRLRFKDCFVRPRDGMWSTAERDWREYDEGVFFWSAGIKDYYPLKKKKL